MAAPVWQSKGTDLTGSASTSAVVALPASLAVGDIVVVALYKENAAAVTKPSVDWTEITIGGMPVSTTAPQTCHAFWFRCVGGETGTVTFSWTGSVWRAASASRVTGAAATGDVIEAVNAAFNNTSASTSPSVSLPDGSGADTLLFWVGTNFVGGNAWGAASPSFTERTDIDVLAVDTRSNVGGLATGSVTATSAISGAQTAVLFSITSTAAGGAVVASGRRRRRPGMRARSLPELARLYRRRGATETAATTGPQIIAVGQAVETGSAQLVARVKVAAVGLVTETDTAQALTSRKTRTLAQVTETDTATNVTKSKLRTVGQSVESDTATTITRRKTRAAGIATETDTATAVTRRGVVSVAVEIDTAQSVQRRKTRLVGQAIDTSTTFTVKVRRAYLLPQIVETDTATAIIRRKLKAAGSATETDTATAATRRKTRAVTQAVEVDSAFLVTGGQHLVAVAVAVEVDIAQPVRVRITTPRPATGFTARPSSGTTTRPGSDVTARPGSGTTPRPFAGTTPRP